jgi:hypothetical protein
MRVDKEEDQLLIHRYYPSDDKKKIVAANIGSYFSILERTKILSRIMKQISNIL